MSSSADTIRMSKSTKRARDSRAISGCFALVRTGCPSQVECTFSVDMSAATIKLSYALAEDAARKRALVNAVPARIVGDCTTLAYFNYDRALYNKLRAIRDDRIGRNHPRAWAGEVVTHAWGQGDPR